MEKNVGMNDRITRGILAIVLIGIGIYTGGAWLIGLAIVGVILGITAATGHCCLYKLMKVDTTKECACCCSGDDSCCTTEKKATVATATSAPANAAVVAPKKVVAKPKKKAAAKKKKR